MPASGNKLSYQIGALAPRASGPSLSKALSNISGVKERQNADRVEVDYSQELNGCGSRLDDVRLLKKTSDQLQTFPLIRRSNGSNIPLDEHTSPLELYDFGIRNIEPIAIH
jgi:hypothetical protein